MKNPNHQDTKDTKMHQENQLDVFDLVFLGAPLVNFVSWW